MKRLKRIMALVIAMAMVLAMAVPVFATSGGTGDNSNEGDSGTAAVATAPTSGTITINSPVVEAEYKVYKIFDMTTNAAVDAFSYTIDANNPFYGAVVAYANDPDNGLILNRIKGSDPAVYNVSVSIKDGEPEGYKKFDAQKFGKAMQKALADGSPEVAADTDKGIVAKDAVAAANVDVPVAAETAVTNPEASDTSDQLTFSNLPLGYFLVNPTYPKASAVTVTLGSDEDGNKQTFTDEDLVKNADGTVKIPRELVKTGDENPENTKIVAYVNATVTNDYVNAYIEAHGITTNKDGSPLNDAGKADYKKDLIKELKKDAEKKVLAAFNNNGSEADINVKEPILVFLDSSQPNAIINEKNELDKWDVPVNPEAGVQPGQPDHGEPEGGKNIIVQEAVEADPTAEPPVEAKPAYSADWSEAEIGESVHYQLRVNAMNFIRTGTTDDTIQQVKEYFLADYQSGHMQFDESKGLHVSVWQGDNENDSQATTGTKNVTKNADGTTAANGYLDYTSSATGANQVFFKNSTTQDANPAPTDVFGTNGTGIMVPWVFVYDPSSVEDIPETTDKNESEDALNAKISQFPIYTITNVPVEGKYETEEFKDGDPTTPTIERIPVKELNDEGEWVDVPGQWVSVNNRIVNDNKQVLDANNNPIQATQPIYTFSLYNSDVTIVVDYWMILKDNAVVDEPGNKNYAQYGWNPIDNKKQDGTPKTPTNPSPEDKPSQKEKVDEATVYTFAIAWVKVDEKGKELADAEFELPFYVKKTKDGDAYVYAGVEYQAAVDAINANQSLSADEKAAQIKALSGESGAYTNKVTTTAESAVITIKGVEQDTYTITETKAPAGYNKLTDPFTVEAKKSGPSVTTKTKTIIYLDRDGNVTKEVTTATTEYDTDEDSFNNSNATDDEEKTVPVYQFDPIVNKQGTELPSTGGIGTTIFYVVGTILVIGAGVILITRRRMDA